MPDSPASLPPCHGVIAAWRLGEGAAPLAPQAVAAMVAAGEAPLWLHFDLVDARARHFLLALPALPQAARAALVEAEEATRIEASGDALYGCLPDIHYDADAPAAPPVGLLHFALTPRLLVTARRHPLRGVHLALQAPQVATPAEALASVLRLSMLEFGQVIGLLGRQMARIEDQLLRPGGDPPRDLLAALRREALRLSRHLDPLAEALDDLAEDVAEARLGPVAPLATPLLLESRRARVAVRALAAVLERGRIAQDQTASRAAEETNRRLLVLSVISAAMLPASLVAGIFGMNVTGVPGVEEPGGFALALALIGASVAGVLVALRLGRLL
ncbi:CorA family divalent cation transporter [Roseomonas sp. F4]